MYLLDGVLEVSFTTDQAISEAEMELSSCSGILAWGTSDSTTAKYYCSSPDIRQRSYPPTLAVKQQRRQPTNPKTSILCSTERRQDFPDLQAQRSYIPILLEKPSSQHSGCPPANRMFRDMPPVGIKKALKSTSLNPSTQTTTCNQRQTIIPLECFYRPQQQAP